MKSSEFRGFSSVFRFTLTQTIKQKSYYITLIIMMLFAIGIFPVTKLINSSDKDEEEEITSIQKVYLVNDTNLDDIPLEEMCEEHEHLSGIYYERMDESVETICSELEDNAKEDEALNSVVLHAKLDLETGGYVFEVYYAPESDVSEDDAFVYADYVVDWFTEYKIAAMDVSEGTLEKITATVTSEVFEYEDYISTETVRIIDAQEYNVVYAMLMLFYMVITITSGMVANKVVEEKANRIVEYLMTTVRPLALMLGKIAAMLVAGVGEVVLILASGAASYVVSEKIWPSEEQTALSYIFSLDGIKELGAVNIAICIIIMILGVIMYGFLGGLFGASVSKMEELQQGLKVFTIMVLIAFFASMIAANLMWTLGINGYVKVIMFVPFTSVMILPGVILIGEVSAIEIIISVLLMVVTAIVLLWFVSLIYESVIVMNGGIVSVRTMFKLAKDSLDKDKGGAQHEEN